MESIIQNFWHIIDRAAFDELTSVMHDDARITLPNTREIFPTRQHYIDFNKAYPGRWHVRIERISPCGDDWMSIVELSDGAEQSLYGIALFTLRQGKISTITEYYGDNGPVPVWRVGKYSTVY